MKNLLNQKQRSQALAWYSTMGFSLENIAEHYGITLKDVARGLRTARTEREAAGKSPEPVPIKAPAGENVPGHADRLLSVLEALELIVWQADAFTPKCALSQIKKTAIAELKKAGKLL